MRRLTALVLLAAVLWSGWWLLGARATQAGFERWMAAQRLEGRVAEAALAVRGYPFRFDTTFRDLAIGDPEGVLWSAERFQTLMLSYAPNRAVLAFPGPQRVSTPFGEVVAEGAEATASIRVGVSADLPLERIALVAREVVATAPGGRVLAEELRAAAERQEGADYHLGLFVAGLALPLPRVAAAIPPPPVIEAIRLDATARLSAPPGRSAAAAPPALEALEVAEARVEWGGMRRVVTGGPVRIGRDGAPYGRLSVRVEEWPRLVEAAVATGLLPERRAPLTIAAMTVIAGDAEPGVIETELVMEGGRMRLGPIPLGPAPRLQRQ